MWPLLLAACVAMNLQEFWPYCTLSARTVHRVDDQRLGTFLNQRVDVGDLFGGVIVGDQRADQRGIVLTGELCLIRNIVSPEVGVVEGQRNTEFEARVRCERASRRR
jgi:hypothetical protein